MSLETNTEYLDDVDSWFDEDIADSSNYLTPEHWSWLNTFVPDVAVMSVQSEPFTMTGLLKGHPFYYTDHLGLAMLNVGAEGSVTPYSPHETLYSQTLETKAGDEVVRVLQNLLYLVPRLERSAFAWGFLGNEVDLQQVNHQWTFEPNGFRRTYTALGMNAEEAYSSLSKTDEFMVEFMGISEEQQKELFALRDISPQPVIVDTRVWPEHDPDFSVYSEG